MADPNALYSYQGGDPKPLPHEIFYTESWGATTFRQDVETFTDEELAKAGYSGPYSVPTYNQETEELQWNSSKLKWDIVERPDPDPGGFNMRTVRNSILASTDWTQLPDNNLTEEQKNIYAEYRQKLRDLPSTVESHYSINWPEDPFSSN